MSWANENARDAITGLEEKVAYLQKDLAATKDEAKKNEKRLKDKLAAAGAIISSLKMGAPVSDAEARELSDEFLIKRADEAAEACERAGLLSNMDNVKERVSKVMFSLLKGD